MKRAAHGLAHLLVVAVALTIGVHGFTGTFGYSLFADRDLTRGLRFFEDFPSAGAELTGGLGARVPGVANGVLFGLPQVFAPGGAPVFALQSMMLAAAVLVLHLGVARRFGAPAGAVAAVLFATARPTLTVNSDLWNPGFTPLFVALATVAALEVAVSRRAVPLVGFAAAVAVGAQLHLAVLLWGLACVPGLIAVRPSGWRRAAPWAVAAVFAAYAPTLIHEALTGWTNTRRLLPQSDAVMSSALRQERLLGRAVELLLLPFDGPASPWAEDALATLGWGVGGVLAVGGTLLAAARIGPRLGTLAPLAWSVLLVLGAYAGGIMYLMNDRYVAPLAPVLGVLGGVAAAEVVRALPRGRSVVALLIGFAVLSRLPWLRHTYTTEGDSHGYASVLATLDALRARTGWTLEEIAGRTVWQRVRAGETPEREHFPAIDHLLRADGAEPPGSLPPPCALLVRGPVGDLSDAGEVARLLGLDAVRDPRPVDTLPTGWQLVLYEPVVGPCPTSMTQRYVDTAAEVAARPLYGRLRAGEVRELPLPDGRRYAVALPWGPTPSSWMPPWIAVVDLVSRGERVVATLSSNQLRGRADNTGWYDVAVVAAPTLVLRSGDRTVEVPFTEGVLGGVAAVTPLTVDFPAPEGAWEVALRVEPRHHDAPWTEDPAAVQEVTLATGWTAR